MAARLFLPVKRLLQSRQDLKSLVQSTDASLDGRISAAFSLLELIDSHADYIDMLSTLARMLSGADCASDRTCLNLIAHAVSCVKYSRCISNDFRKDICNCMLQYDNGFSLMIANHVRAYLGDPVLEQALIREADSASLDSSRMATISRCLGFIRSCDAISTLKTMWHVSRSRDRVWVAFGLAIAGSGLGRSALLGQMSHGSPVAPLCAIALLQIFDKDAVLFLKQRFCDTQISSTAHQICGLVFDDVDTISSGSLGRIEQRICSMM